MKRTLIFSIVAASMAVLTLVPTARAGEPSECTLATLQGRYLVTSRSEQPSDVTDPTFPRIFTGVWTFDGEGNWSFFQTASWGGQIRRGVSGTGTYMLGSDCMGTLHLGPNNADIYVSRDGSLGHSIRTDEGVIALATFKKDNDK